MMQWLDRMRGLRSPADAPRIADGVQLRVVPRPLEFPYDFAAAPAGSMFRWPAWDAFGRECWVVRLPGTAGWWWTTMCAQDSELMWNVTGTPPRITVTPSINVQGRWHGFITDGRFVSAG